MKTLKERVAIEQALVDGKIVQEVSGSGHTTDCNPEHVFYWNVLDYRIKPEPMEFYLSFWDNGAMVVSKTMSGAPAGLKTIKVREVTDE